MENIEATNSYIGIEDAAQFLGISVPTLRVWLKQKDIPAHKVGKLWKFKLVELDEWVKSGGSPI